MLLKNLLNKKMTLTQLSERVWVNPACVPYQPFFSFLLPFLLLISLSSCVWAFYCMKVGLTEGERLKGQVLAAEAWRDEAMCDTELIINMTVNQPGACIFYSPIFTAHSFSVPARYPPLITRALLKNTLTNCSNLSICSHCTITLKCSSYCMSILV